MYVYESGALLHGILSSFLHLPICHMPNSPLSSLPKHITIRSKNISSLQCFVVSQMGSHSGVACAHLYIVFWWMHILTSPRLLLSISLNICEHNKQANSMTYITSIAQPKCILFSKKSFHWKPRTHPTIHYGYTYSQYLEPNWTELN